ncbi:putative leader peptide [Saccharopolyspora sp. NPDC002376]
MIHLVARRYVDLVRVTASAC